jgi:hypothetical protein
LAFIKSHKAANQERLSHIFKKDSLSARSEEALEAVLKVAERKLEMQIPKSAVVER